MKKLFALMLALMLALAGVSAVSAEDAAAAPVAAASSGTINLKVSLNGEGIASVAGAADENAAKMVSSIVELVNNLGITMTSDGKDAELLLSLKDQPMAGVGVIKNEDKMLLVSDLFPSYALVLDGQAMSGMMSGMSGGEAGGLAAGAAGGFTMPQISLSDEQMSSLMAPFAKVSEEIQAKIGEPEAVDEAMYGATYTEMRPLNMTTKELLDIVLPAAKEVMAQESFTSLIDQLKAQGMNVNFDAEEINKKIDELQAKKEEELPVMNAALFSNEAGDNMFILHLDKEEESFALHTGTTNGATVFEMNVGTKFYIMLESGSETNLTIQLAPQEGMLIDIEGNMKGDEKGFSATFTVKLNDTELGTLAIDGTPNGVLSGNYTADGKTEITIAEMQDQTGEKAKAFMTDFQVGLGGLMQKAMTALPSIATLFMPQIPQNQQ